MTDSVIVETNDVSASTPTAEPADTLTAVRDLVLRAHPDVIAELVQGDSIDELIASVEPATAAYLRLASRFESPATTEPVVEVPAGSSAPLVMDVDRLPTAEKLRIGIRDRQRHPIRGQS